MDPVRILAKAGAVAAEANHSWTEEQRAAALAKAAEARRANAGLQGEVKAAEADAVRLTARRSAIDRALFDPRQAEPADAKLTATELMKLRAAVERDLETAEARWLELSERMEQALAA